MKFVETPRNNLRVISPATERLLRRLEGAGNHWQKPESKHRGMEYISKGWALPMPYSTWGENNCNLTLSNSCLVRNSHRESYMLCRCHITVWNIGGLPTYLLRRHFYFLNTFCLSDLNKLYIQTSAWIWWIQRYKFCLLKMSVSVVI